MHLRGGDPEAAHINAIEAQHGQGRGIRRQYASVMGDRRLRHAEATLKDRGGAVAPVVEIAGDDDRQVARSELFQPAGDRFELARASTLVQREMHAHAMNVAPPAEP